MNGARSLLFVPATSERKIDRAFAAGADGVIVDLEDAVATSQKQAARDALATIFAVPRANAYVRVNAASTAHCLRDLYAVPLGAVAGIVGLVSHLVQVRGEVRRLKLVGRDIVVRWQHVAPGR